MYKTLHGIICTILIIYDVIVMIDCTKKDVINFTSPTEKSMCFGKLGCVQITSEWYDAKRRPTNELPLSRHTVNTQFILYTLDKSDSNKPLLTEIVSSVPATINISSYVAQNPLKLLIHDFTSNGYTGWIKHMARAFLQLGANVTGNVVSVNWEAGAQPPYTQAVGNARLVALEVTDFLRMLYESHGLTVEHVHIVGHGVGAHIAGWVGKAQVTSNKTKIAKITGLDPSGPHFEGMPEFVKLDITDAKYVEVLHTDAEPNGQGITEVLGHIDFFANKGFEQPGCNYSTKYPLLLKLTRNSLPQGMIYPGCSHKRSFKYYIDAVNKDYCSYIGFNCKSYESFMQAECTSCALDDNTIGCARLAHNSPIQFVNENQTCSNQYFFQTGNTMPFCTDLYKATIHFAGTKGASPTYNGYLEFNITDGQQTITHMKLNEFKEVPIIYSGKNQSFLGWHSPPPTITKANEVFVRWFRRSSNHQPLYISNFTLTLLNDQAVQYPNEMCSTGKSDITEFQSDEREVFTNCRYDTATHTDATDGPKDINDESNLHYKRIPDSVWHRKKKRKNAYDYK